MGGDTPPIVPRGWFPSLDVRWRLLAPGIRYSQRTKRNQGVEQSMELVSGAQLGQYCIVEKAGRGSRGARIV